MCYSAPAWINAVKYIARLMLMVSFILLVGVRISTEGLKCLQCKNVPAPRHCTSVTECFQGEVCGVEKITSDFGVELFNVGCMKEEKCVSEHHEHECIQCCNSTICNDKGCGKQGYPGNRGPVCYNCPVHSGSSPCHTIDICSPGEICLFEAMQEFEDLLYSSRCLDHHACMETNFIGSSIVGRAVDKTDEVRNAEQRSMIKPVCRNCCDQDLCNTACNGSLSGLRVIQQWVENVTAYSSQYAENSWTASQVIGSPDVYPQAGDSNLAWCARYMDANQSIQVQFAEAVYITGVNIFETYNPGGVKAIKALSGGFWITLWSTDQVQVLQGARIFSPPLSSLTSPSKDLRLELDLTAAYSEIDAIQLLGTRTRIF